MWATITTTDGQVRYIPVHAFAEVRRDRVYNDKGEPTGWRWTLFTLNGNTYEVASASFSDTPPWGQ